MLRRAHNARSTTTATTTTKQNYRLILALAYGSNRHCPAAARTLICFNCLNGAVVLKAFNSISQASLALLWETVGDHSMHGKVSLLRAKCAVW